MFLKALLARLWNALLALGPEIAAALWRLLLILLLLLLLLLRLLFRLLTRRRDEGKIPNCRDVPPHVKRKPDPCLYSQFYLMALGLAVTWDNPDIWITLPDGTPVPSHGLQPGADYLVHARIHDASFDPALATEVRCFYRPWSFNSPDRVPVEVTAGGQEKVVVLHIAPWSTAEAVFRWRTPPTPGAHWCLQVECRHPDDKNPNNNLGQENTDVVAAAPGAEVTATAALWNRGDAPARFRLHSTRYAIPTGEVTLRLDRRSIPLRRRQPFDAIFNALLSRDAARGGLKTQNQRALAWVAYAYRGFDEVWRANQRGAAVVAAPWAVRVNGREPREGFVQLDMKPGERQDVTVAIRVPAEARRGERYPFNFAAIDPSGKTVGGITVIVDVR